MAKAQWHDINDPGFFKKTEESKAPASSGPEEEPVKKKEDPEVRLSDPSILPGDNGFEFNKPCKVRVKVDYLRQTVRKRVTFQLFSVYKNKTSNMNHEVGGFEEKGFAETDMTLFYNNDYYQDAIQNGRHDDPDAVVDYFFKARHSTGANEVQSEMLRMPALSEGKKQMLASQAGKLKDAARSGAACCGECTSCKNRQSCEQATSNER
jgi:hypothetical protein